jgi:hypothetical protein
MFLKVERDRKRGGRGPGKKKAEKFAEKLYLFRECFGFRGIL